MAVRLCDAEQERKACRNFVESVKAGGRIHIIASNGNGFILNSDEKLSHDIALVVQDYFRRTGRDKPTKNTRA